MQNYPNPAEDITDIAYELANPSEVEIEINDFTGRTVLMIQEGNLPAGKHNIRVSTGNLDPGVYFYTLKAGEFVNTKHIIISK